MKRSLCIGINDYPGTGSDLQGCVNDAQDWKQELHKRGFAWQDTLLDKRATHRAMCEAIADIVVATKPGDIAVITYSGHGTWTPDKDGDEPDGRDEALCPYDLDSAGPLGDDYLHDIFKHRNPGARIVFISDSCHSGSVTRMTQRLPGWRNPAVERRPVIRFLPPGHFMTPEQMRNSEKATKLASRSVIASYTLLLSGCDDREYSYDANFKGKPNGAFTYLALHALKSMNKDSTYSDWFKEIRTYLPSQFYPQTPQMVGDKDQCGWRIFSEA